jgi:hypothetical protein
VLGVVTLQKGHDLPPDTVRAGGALLLSSAMLFMVQEQFRQENLPLISDRFMTQGRLMPDGVEYVSSWVDPEKLRCYQVMEAESRELLDQWIANWSDIVQFEIAPVKTSMEFWESV